MKRASDFRLTARGALKGRWGVAVLAGFLAAILGAVSMATPKLDFNLGSDGFSANISVFGQNLFSSGGASAGILGGVLLSWVLFIGLAILVIKLVIGSVVQAGYARFNLNLVDHQQDVQVNTLFSYFSFWSNLVLTSLLQALYIFLWSLLLVIPGIMAAYSYAMTPYILAENPRLTPSEAIAASKELMRGNRWRLFCLQFSFIGWEILCSFTFGIGNLWLTPYRQAAEAAFYREISDVRAADVL